MSKDDMYMTGAEAFKAYANQKEDEIEREAIPRGGAAKAFGSAGYRTFENWATNISVRSDYNRGDYEYFRPSYTVPTQQKEIISMCMEAYQKVGLVRNVIDLMGDFGAQGIRLQHPVPATQEFYNSWWEKVGGSIVSERFLNLLYRGGQVVVKANYGKVSVYEERKWRKGKAQDIQLEKIKPVKREIPLKYTFIDILSLEVLGKELAPFVGQPVLALKITPKLKSAITTALSKNAKLSAEVQKMVSKIPADVAEAIMKGQQYLPLDMDKTHVCYYKKDDWLLWANPMTAAILDDLLMLNKLKLADISALDGAISNIRLWTLGIIGDSPATSILPTKAGINKLRSILANNVGGGVLDLVYGPELKFTESNSQVWRFLGSEKYTTTINAVYEGLGVPAPLRAGAGQSNTGNFVGLNTLVKRLQYGRDRLMEFWIKQLKYVHKAMGFPGKPPQIIFDFMALADEAAEKQLLINLWDRDIIGDESILEIFGRLPLVEKSRVRREANERNNETMPYKASPFHNPDKEHEYRKIILQAGEYAPSEIGIDLQDRDTNQQSDMEKKHEREKELMKMEMDFESKTQDKELKQKTEIDKEKLRMKNDLDKKRLQQEMTIKRSQVGRPKNITETKKRKPKPTGKPSTRAFVDIFLWANTAQEVISKMVTKAILAGFEKPNLRSLSQDEFDLYEQVKLDILCAFEPFAEISEEAVFEALSNRRGINGEVLGASKMLMAQFVANTNRQPKIEELRQIYSSAYALIHEN